jgi:hypothetical protein
MSTKAFEKFEAGLKDAVEWSKIAAPAKEAYWRYRSNGADENGALFAALDVAIAIATGQLTHQGEK